MVQLSNQFFDVYEFDDGGVEVIKIRLLIKALLLVIPAKEDSRINWLEWTLEDDRLIVTTYLKHGMPAQNVKETVISYRGAKGSKVDL